MTRPLLVAIVLALGPTLAAAQGPVYESKDKAGPVFSDQPTTGAKPVDLGPANVIQTTPTPQQRAPAAPSVTYTALAISTPENGGTIHSNTGAFDVSVRLQPSLQGARGDRIIARLDGRALGSRFSSVRFGVTEADWQSTASPDKEEHTLQVAVVDKSGAVLIESAPVKFYARRAFQARERAR